MAKKAHRRHLLKRIFYPHFNELSLFIVACGFIFSMYLEGRLFAAFKDFLITLTTNPLSFILGCAFVYGFWVSIRHVFTSRKKTTTDKIAMGIFGVFINIIVSIGLFAYILLEKSSEPWALLSIIHIVNIMILLWVCLNGHLEETVADSNYPLVQTLVSVVLVVLLGVLMISIMRLNAILYLSIITIFASNISFSFRRHTHRR